MKKISRFLILNSPIHAYTRIYAVFVLCLLIGVCLYISRPFLFLCPLICSPILLYAEWILWSIVEFDSNGIYWNRPFGKRHCIPWSAILCAGEINIGVSFARTKALYFSTTPVDLKEMRKSDTLPKLTDSFVFVTIQPGVYEALSQHDSPALHKKLTEERADREENTALRQDFSRDTSSGRKIMLIASFVATILVALLGIHTSDMRWLIVAFLFSLVFALQLMRK